MDLTTLYYIKAAYDQDGPKAAYQELLRQIAKLEKTSQKVKSVDQTSNELKSKSDQVKLYNAGAFGNKPVTYKTVYDLLASDYSGNVSMRHAKLGSWKSQYDVPKDQVLTRCKTLQVDPNDIYCTQSPPEHKITIQGEVMLSIDHYDITYSELTKPMKLALAEAPQYATGLKAAMLLRCHFNASSYADLQVLFEKYPKSVIEFTCFSCNFGSIPGRNTVIWEVRNY
jgi:hypothetical protein